MKFIILFYILYLRSAEYKVSTSEVSKKCEGILKAVQLIESEKKNENEKVNKEDDLENKEDEKLNKEDEIENKNIFDETFENKIKEDESYKNILDNKKGISDDYEFNYKNLEEFVYKAINEYNKNKKVDFTDFNKILLYEQKKISNYKIKVEKEIDNLKIEIQNLKTNFKTEIESKIMKEIDEKFKSKNDERDLFKKVTENIFGCHPPNSESPEVSKDSSQSKNSNPGNDLMSNLIQMFCKLEEMSGDGSNPKTEVPSLNDLLKSLNCKDTKKNEKQN